MMRMKTKPIGLSTMNCTSAASGDGCGGGVGEWEVRPGGMVVQKRDPDSDQNRVPAPTIRVKVKYGSNYHEISISSQATFGELKKMLLGQIGLHHQDQKLFFKDKERDSKSFLDIVGVKDKSKIVLVEDPISQEKRYIEMRKNARIEKAAKSISDVSLEIDKLAGQVSALETEVSKVEEKQVINLTDQLMNQLLKLDEIIADGDTKLQRKIQVKRIKKYVTTLDMLKIKNSIPTSNGTHIPKQRPSTIQLHQQQMHSKGHIPSTLNQQQSRRSVGYLHTPMQKNRHYHPQQTSRHSSSGGVVITTQWETFDSNSTPLSAATSTSRTASTTIDAVQHKYNWDLL